MTTAEQVFGLLLEGVLLPATQHFSVPELQLTAKLEPAPPLRLIVRLVDVSQQEADHRAFNFAQELYFRSLLRFGSMIERSEPPRLLTKTFTEGGSVSATAVVPTPARLSVRAGTFPLPQTELNDLAADLQLRVITPQVSTTAQLYAAIGMFAAGMEAQNAVVRFLVLYSALTLAALFKWRNGGQQSVDRLLLDKNPGITYITFSEKCECVGNGIHETQK